jgi:hypothetical protein
MAKSKKNKKFLTELHALMKKYKVSIDFIDDPDEEGFMYIHHRVDFIDDEGKKDYDYDEWFSFETSSLESYHIKRHLKYMEYKEKNSSCIIP